MAAGEYDIIINAQTIHGVRNAREGAPIECATGEYSPYFPWSAALVEDAPNTKAGEVFLNWIFSEQVQLAIQETMGYSALREGLDVPVMDTEWYRASLENPQATPESLVNENYDELVATFNELFTEPID